MTPNQILYLTGGAAGLLLIVTIVLVVIRSRLKSDLAAAANRGYLDRRRADQVRVQTDAEFLAVAVGQAG